MSEKNQIKKAASFTFETVSISYMYNVQYMSVICFAGLIILEKDQKNLHTKKK